MLLTGLLLWACSVCHLVQPRAACPRWHCPQWFGPFFISYNQENAPLACLEANLMGKKFVVVVVEICSSQQALACLCQVDQNPNQPSPCFPSCLKQDPLLFADVYAKWAGPQASGDPSIQPPISLQEPWTCRIAAVSVSGFTWIPEIWT